MNKQSASLAQLSNLLKVKNIEDTDDEFEPTPESDYTRFNQLQKQEVDRIIQHHHANLNISNFQDQSMSQNNTMIQYNNQSQHYNPFAPFPESSTPVG